MEHSAHVATGPGPAQQRCADLRMGLAIVDEHRLAGARRKVELAGECLALHVRRGQVAKEVETDLADRHGVALPRQRLQPRPVRRGGSRDEMRMDPDSRHDQARVLGSERERCVRGGEVVAGDQDPVDAGGQGALDDRLAVDVKGLALQVAVRVDETGQGATSCATSTRGKIGIGCPVRHSLGPPPQASSVPRPGPPTPRAS